MVAFSDFSVNAHLPENDENTYKIKKIYFSVKSKLWAELSNKLHIQI